MKPMRIAINALAVLPGIEGGGPTYVKGIVRGLLEVGSSHRFLIFLTRRSRSLFEPLPSNVEVCEVGIDNRLRFWRVIYEQFVLPGRIREWHADVSFFPLNMMPLSMTGESTLLVIHDASPQLYLDELRRYAPRLRTRLILRLEQESARRASRVISPTYFAASEVSKLTSIPASEIFVVSPGREPWIEEDELAQDLRPNAPYILLVGHLHKHKNFDGFIGDYTNARKRFGFPHHLVIVGPPGSGHADVEHARDRSEVRDDIHILGAIGAPELAKLYAHSALFVLPSRYEGFGFPLLEAMDFGIPCIATRCCSLPEVAADAAVYVDPEEPEEMIRALGTMLLDPDLRRKYSELGKARASTFSWQIAASKLLAIIDLIQSGK
jgi:glycosyltransferase involved in cell wall biosynthesis